MTTVFSTSLGVCLAFYFRRKYFVLIDHILSENICLFYFYVLFFFFFFFFFGGGGGWWGGSGVGVEEVGLGLRLVHKWCNFDSKVTFFICLSKEIFLLLFF